MPAAKDVQAAGTRAEKLFDEAVRAGTSDDDLARLGGINPFWHNWGTAVWLVGFIAVLVGGWRADVGGVKGKVDYIQRSGMTYLLRTGYNWQALKMYDADCTVANPFYNPEVKQVVAASRICAYCNRSVVVLDPRALGDTVLCHAAVLIGGPVVLRPDNGTASNTESAKLSGVQGLLGAFNAIEATSTSGRFSDDGCKYRTSLGDEFRTGVEVLRAMGGGVSASTAAALPSEGWEVMWSNCDDAGMAAVSTAIPAQPTCVSAPAFATSVHLVGGQKRHVVDAPIKRGPYRRKGAIENLNWLTVLSGGLNVSLRPAPCSLNGAHCSRVRALLNPGDVVVYRQKMWAASVTVVGASAAFTRHTAKYDLAAAIAQDDKDRS